MNDEGRKKEERGKRKEGGSTKLFRDDSVNAFADGDDIHDLQGTQIRFGGDVFLKPGAERAAELVTSDGED